MLFIPVFVAVDTDDPSEARQAAQIVVDHSNYESHSVVEAVPAGGTIVPLRPIPGHQD